MLHNLSPNIPLAGRTLVSGHFGELIQGRLGPEGPLALISLPCPALWVECAAGLPAFSGLIGPNRVKALCNALSLPLPINMPGIVATMPPGGGAGSSTAGLVAIARHLGFTGSPEVLARACVLAEGASDPLMFAAAERLLFAPRAGHVMRTLPALPRFEVVGGFFGPVLRTDPVDLAFADIADLVTRWQPDMSLPQLAELTSISAQRNLALRGPESDPTSALAADLGALGWVIAHTGNARGLIFPPGMVPPVARATLESAGFANVIQFFAGGTA